MTTIIVVVVVALVFFVAVCVVAFMIWKREAEMRTDSIRAIEENLERLTQEMSPEQEMQDRQHFAEKEAGISYMESLIAQSAAGRSAGRRTRRPGQDPFEWVRANGETVRSSGSDQEKPFRINPEPDFEEDRREESDRGEGSDPYGFGLTDSENVLKGTMQNEPDNVKAGAAESGDHGSGMAEQPAADTADPETADAQGPSQIHDRYDDTDIGDDTDDRTSAGASDSGSGTGVRTPVPEAEICRKKSALTEMQKMLKELEVPELRNMPETQMDADADAGETELSAEAADEGSEIRRSGDEDHENHDDREEQHDEKESYEISLDLIDEMDIDSEQEQMPTARMGYDVGRSGRKYTASELEKLIKE